MSYTILIVDDSDIIRSALEKTLHISKLPIDTVFKAENGRAALHILEHHWVDLVLTDVHMPEMSGTELVDEMQKRADFCTIPVIIISTEGSSAKIEQLLNGGARGYLRKPFTPEQVRAKVLEIIGAHS